MRRLLHVIRNSDGTGRFAFFALLLAWAVWAVKGWMP